MIGDEIESPRWNLHERGTNPKGGLTEGEGGGERKVEHNGAWSVERLIFRVDDTTTYIRICIRMFAVNADAVARKRSINQFVARSSPQARRPSEQCHACTRETWFVRSCAARPTHHFFLSLLLLPFFFLPLMERKREREKSTTARGWRGRRAYTRASHGTRINYNRLNGTRVLACDACKRRPCARSFRYIRLGRFEYFLNTFPYFYGWTSL